MLIYFHTPFCVKKCKYCDFSSFENKDEFIMSYFEAASREIEEKAKRYGDESVESVYFGGGTPTAVRSEYAVKTLELIKRLFRVKNDAEITIEANPGTFDGEKLVAYKNAGFNRISIGVQSFWDDELTALGRIHDGEKAKESVKIAKSVFDNVSLDLMLGLEGQTEERVKKSLDEAIKLNVDHISAYMLIVEDGTKLKELVESGNYKPLSDDDCAKTYDFAAKYLEENGYDRYEVSNFAKNGARSTHNEGYWRMKNYVGIGLSAHSLVNDRRFFNTSDMEEYIKSPTKEQIEETLSEKDFEEEYIMLALRTTDGIDLNDYKLRFQKDFKKEKGQQLQKLERFLDITEDSVSISKNHVSVGTAITAELLD